MKTTRLNEDIDRAIRGGGGMWNSTRMYQNAVRIWIYIRHSTGMYQNAIRIRIFIIAAEQENWRF